MSAPYYADELVTVHAGDCLDVLAAMPDCSVDAVVTDPPYGLEFMGKDWDAPWQEKGINADATFTDVALADGFARLPRPTFTGSTNPSCLTCGGTRRGRRDGTAVRPVCLCDDGGQFPNVRAVEMRTFGAWCEAWSRECLRVLKPGGYMLAFGGSRTWHRLASAVEDAGFEIRDSIAWLYGSGFPKSLNIGDGRGTALKPAFEPIVVGRKPLAGTVAANVQAWGTGALNIDATRINPGEPVSGGGNGSANVGGIMGPKSGVRPLVAPHRSGRWPANVVLDGDTADELDRQTGDRPTSSGILRRNADTDTRQAYGTFGGGEPGVGYGDSGGASRFFPTFRYEAKAPTAERPRGDDGTAHPTVKPLDLMRWLVRLVTPPGGLVLDPFLGSGTTAEACVIEGFRCIGIEREPAYLPLITARLSKPISGVLDFGEVSA